jgi:hypothetical protein
MNPLATPMRFYRSDGEFFGPPAGVILMKRHRVFSPHSRGDWAG